MSLSILLTRYADVLYTPISASQVNRASWTVNVGAPVMLIDRILLIQVQLEELVVPIALEVLEANCGISRSDLVTCMDDQAAYEFNFLKLASIIALSFTSTNLPS